MVFIERTDFKEVSGGCEGSCLLLSPVLRSLHLFCQFTYLLLQMNQPLPEMGVGRSLFYLFDLLKSNTLFKGA